MSTPLPSSRHTKSPTLITSSSDPKHKLLYFLALTTVFSNVQAKEYATRWSNSLPSCWDLRLDSTDIYCLSKKNCPHVQVKGLCSLVPRGWLQLKMIQGGWTVEGVQITVQSIKQTKVNWGGDTQKNSIIIKSDRDSKSFKKLVDFLWLVNLLHLNFWG